MTAVEGVAILPAMARPPRASAGGIVYHVLNRGNGRMTLFEGDGDYIAFETLLSEAIERYNMRLCSYCILPNHWHMLLWPHSGDDSALSKFVGWISLSHAKKWLAYHESSGTGHVYQDRFKSFPVESDEHFLTVARYVERNALRANLVKNAEDWRWGSLWARNNAGSAALAPALSDWPIEIPANWSRLVNTPLSEAEEQAIRRAIVRSSPYGSERWTQRTAEKLGLEATLRPRGRPRKASA